MPQTTVPVEEFTTPDPITANEEMAIDVLRELMLEHGIRHLPIVRGDAVVGVVSDRDVRLVSGLTPGRSGLCDVREESRQRDRDGRGRQVSGNLHCHRRLECADRDRPQRSQVHAVADTP
jgi:CBS-domain-containing membrane protein